MGAILDKLYRFGIFPQNGVVLISGLIQAFIFDMDGVIADTVEYHYLSLKKLFDEEGVPFTRADNRDLLGLSRGDSLRLILNRYGRVVSEEHFQILYERKNQYFLELVCNMTPADILPGIKELIGSLKQAGIKIAVASSSRNTTFILKALGVYHSFDLIVDSNTVATAKPAPDLFLYTAARLGANPGQTVVIEDAAAGIQAARAAGMLVIGLGKADYLNQADRHFSSAKEIEFPGLISSLEKVINNKLA